MIDYSKALMKKKIDKVHKFRTEQDHFPKLLIFLINLTCNAHLLYTILQNHRGQN